jgi:hypothetical protein
MPSKLKDTKAPMEDEIDPDFDGETFEALDTIDEVDDADDIGEDGAPDGDDDGDDDDGFDEASFGDFDPMQALGQLLVTQDGETIPDTLVGIKHSIDTLTKVLHKIGKTLEKK